MRRILISCAMVATMMATGGFNAANASPPPEHKVTICHRTNSETNPYVKITVDVASAGYQHSGHEDRHEGPVYREGLKEAGIKWGDIIPPYEYDDFAFEGQNWTAEGQAIWNNDCEVPHRTPSVVPSHGTRTPAVVPSGGAQTGGGGTAGFQNFGVMVFGLALMALAGGLLGLRRRFMRI